MASQPGSNRTRIKDAQHESALFRNRAIAGFLLIAACLGLLGVRFFYLQVSRHEEFASRSDSNRISIRRIVPRVSMRSEMQYCPISTALPFIEDKRVLALAASTSIISPSRPSIRSEETET